MIPWPYALACMLCVVAWAVWLLWRQCCRENALQARILAMFTAYQPWPPWEPGGSSGLDLLTAEDIQAFYDTSSIIPLLPQPVIYPTAPDVAAMEALTSASIAQQRALYHAAQTHDQAIYNHAALAMQQQQAIVRTLCPAGLGNGDQHAVPPNDSEVSVLPGYLCEQCLDASAVQVQPATWGGDMGVCAACTAPLDSPPLFGYHCDNFTSSSPRDECASRGITLIISQ